MQGLQAQPIFTVASGATSLSKCGLKKQRPRRRAPHRQLPLQTYMKLWGKNRLNLKDPQFALWKHVP